MSLKTKNIIRTLFKISILSLIIFALFHYGSNLFNKEEKTKINSNKKTQNIQNFENVNITPIANVGVAISTNIGIKYTSKQNGITSPNIYKELFSVEDILRDKSGVKEEIIGKNMIFLKEYFNFVKLDFNKIITNSNNKKISLENIIKQLELRYKQSLTNQKYLTEQKNIILVQYNKVITKIDSIKQDIFNSYNQTNTENTYKEINNYYSLKFRETRLKLYLVFIDNFLKNYISIDSYNKILLDTIINNKDIITKGSYVVIPNSGSQLLDNFGLIIDENEFKTKKED